MQQPPLPLLCAQPQATPGSHRHVWRATAMFRDGSVGSKKSGFVIVWSQIPGGKFLACFSGRISNHRPAANPLRPGPGNPINCVRQRELVQLTPIQEAFDWQTKDTATWRLMLGPRWSKPPSSSPPPHGSDPAVAWSRSGSVQENRKSLSKSLGDCVCWMS